MQSKMETPQQNRSPGVDAAVLGEALRGLARRRVAARRRCPVWCTASIATLFAFAICSGWLRPQQALNRLLFEPSEVVRAGQRHRVVLPFADRRAAHVASVLQLKDGDSVRVGVLDGGADDAAVVRWVWPEGSSGRWSREDREGQSGRRSTEELQSFLSTEADLPEALELSFNATVEAALQPPRVDLLLAPCSTDQLKRLLPQIGQLGVGTLILCNAARCPNAVFGNSFVNDPAAVRQLLVEGLVQSGDIWVPRVVVAKRFKPFITSDELDFIALRDDTIRLVATSTGGRVWHAVNGRTCSKDCSQRRPRILIAIGPDGGWLDPGESALLHGAAFQPVSFGRRSFDQESAVCAALALGADAIRRLHATPL